MDAHEEFKGDSSKGGKESATYSNRNASPKKALRTSLPEEYVKLATEAEGFNPASLNQLDEVNTKFNSIIENLDQSLNGVLRKQEYEYLQAYNIYVKRKEKELRELIGALNEKNSNNNFKDQRINQLEVLIDKMRKDAFNQERKVETLQNEVKQWKDKFKMEVDEKQFFHKQALDAKRKNKLLKVAISRIQAVEPIEAQKPAMLTNKEEQDGDEQEDGKTFLTGANV